MSHLANLFIFLCVCAVKVTYLRRFAALHRTCAAHLADQWAGQLEDLDKYTCGEVGRRMRKHVEEKAEDV